jgi:hypothetical protein
MSGLLLACTLICLFEVSDRPFFPVPVHAPEPQSYLFDPAFELDRELRGQPCPYAIQPGDICFALNSHVMSRIGHFISGAGTPNHSMIAFQHPNGYVAILEAGPQSRLVLEVNEAYKHLGTYEAEGSRVWVRRRKSPLTPEQSAELTRFCMAQDGKNFPALRLAGQLTLFRSRTPVRGAYRGKPDLDQRTYFCSELVLNSLVAGGVLDPEPLRPSATYPSDLFFNSSRNRHVDRGIQQLMHDWDPPARWVSRIVTH